jgi:hypothetical protein
MVFATRFERIFPSKNIVKRHNQLFDAAALRETLEAALAEETNPPLSVRELARQIGIGEVRLHRHCPDLCSEIVRRYHNYRKLQGITRLQHMHEDLKDTIFHLYRQGYYPSLRKVREVLKEKKYAYKDFNDAWRSIMQDLQTDRDKQAPS